MRDHGAPIRVSGRTFARRLRKECAVRSACWRVTVRIKLIAIFLGLSLVAVPLAAHHGNAAYDTSKTITVKATVTEWFWANPHCFLRLDAKDDKGNVVHWSIEASNPSDMVNLGWSNKSFKPGDEVTASFNPVKSGAPVGRILKVVLADGQVLSGRVVFKSTDTNP